MNIRDYSEAACNEAIEILQAGGVIAHATETCYGLACDLTNPEAVQKLFLIKNRPEDKPVSGLFASIDDTLPWVTWNVQAEELAAQYLPGPLTIILPIRSDTSSPIFPIPNSQTSKQVNPQTLGIRISSHPHSLDLARRFGKPLSTTSANVHGKENPYSVENIVSQFSDQEHQPDLVLDSGELPKNPPSTIIDCTKESPSNIRSGTITA